MFPHQTSLINPSLQGLIFILLLLITVFVPSEPHMPSWLINTDGQKITFSMSIIGKCMSCTAEHCHSSLWLVICDSGAKRDSAFKSQATASQSRLASKHGWKKNMFDQRKGDRNRVKRVEG